MPPFFTSIRLKRDIGHDVVAFWQNHGKCGELVVDKGTGEVLTNLLKIHTDKITIWTEE